MQLRRIEAGWLNLSVRVKSAFGQTSNGVRLRAESAMFAHQ